MKKVATIHRKRNVSVPSTHEKMLRLSHNKRNIYCTVIPSASFRLAKFQYIPIPRYSVDEAVGKQAFSYIADGNAK